MKNLTIKTSFAFLLLALISHAQEPILPKAFYKGALVTSISGGPSKAIYSTFDNEGKKVKSDIAQGAIDPLIMEYGYNNKIGFGFSFGGENYGVNANEYYNAQMPEYSNMMNVQTKYLTLDLSYHPYTTKRFDLSLFAGLGYFKVSGATVNFQDIGMDNSNTASSTLLAPEKLFSYNGHGTILRTGIRSRFYVTKRFGLMAMIYGFNGIAKEKYKPSSITDQKNNSGYGTMITGRGFEFGLCFRIFKQKGVTNQTQIVETETSEVYVDTNKGIAGLFGTDNN